MTTSCRDTSSSGWHRIFSPDPGMPTIVLRAENPGQQPPLSSLKPKCSEQLYLEIAVFTVAQTSHCSVELLVNVQDWQHYLVERLQLLHIQLETLDSCGSSLTWRKFYLGRYWKIYGSQAQSVAQSRDSWDVFPLNVLKASRLKHETFSFGSRSQKEEVCTIQLFLYEVVQFSAHLDLAEGLNGTWDDREIFRFCVECTDFHK